MVTIRSSSLVQWPWTQLKVIIMNMLVDWSWNHLYYHKRIGIEAHKIDKITFIHFRLIIRCVSIIAKLLGCISRASIVCVVRMVFSLLKRFFLSTYDVVLLCFCCVFFMHIGEAGAIPQQPKFRSDGKTIVGNVDAKRDWDGKVLKLVHVVIIWLRL